MSSGYASHVGNEHPEVATYPEPFIRMDFRYCPYCGVEL